MFPADGDALIPPATTDKNGTVVPRVNIVRIGGNHCPRSAITHIAASTAPAAPSKCPMLAFVELTGIPGAASPAQALIAAASAPSFNGVPVPCALI